MTNHLLITSLLVASAASAVAGYRTENTVSISTSGTTRRAMGSLGAARNSPDNVQYLECTHLPFGEKLTQVSCSARNAAGDTLHCYSIVESQVAVVASMTDSSWIHFGVDTASTNPSRCAYIFAAKGSKFAPPQP